LDIPKEMRGAMGIPEGGSDLLLSVGEDGELRAITRGAALRRIQHKLKALVPPGVSAMDELIADRRAEAAREETEAGEAPSRRAPPRVA